MPGVASVAWGHAFHRYPSPSGEEIAVERTPPRGRAGVGLPARSAAVRALRLASLVVRRLVHSLECARTEEHRHARRTDRLAWITRRRPGHLDAMVAFALSSGDNVESFVPRQTRSRQLHHRPRRWLSRRQPRSRRRGVLRRRLRGCRRARLRLAALPRPPTGASTNLSATIAGPRASSRFTTNGRAPPVGRPSCWLDGRGCPRCVSRYWIPVPAKNPPVFPPGAPGAPAGAPP